MNLLDSLKKKKQKDPEPSVPIIDVSTLLPVNVGVGSSLSTEKASSSTPPLAKEAAQPPPQHSTHTPVRMPSGSPIKFAIKDPSSDINPGSITKKRTYRLRKHRKATKVTALSGSQPHQDPEQLIASSFIDQGRRETLVRRLRSIPREQTIEGLSLQNNTEGVEELASRITSVHATHMEGEYDQLRIIQAGLDEVRKSSGAFASLACGLHLLKGDEHRIGGDLEAAEEEYSLALGLARAGNADDPALVSAISLDLGNIAMEGEDVETALGHYMIASDLESDIPEVWVNLAIAHAINNDHDKSRKCIERSLKHESSDPDALFLKGVIQYLQKDIPGAIDTWTRSLQHDHEDDEIRKFIGRVYLDIGDFQKAIHTLEKVVKERPGDNEVWNLLGLAYTELGDAEHAVTSYQRAFGVDGQESPSSNFIPGPDAIERITERSMIEPHSENEGGRETEAVEKCWNEALEMDKGMQGGGLVDPEEIYDDDQSYSRAIECFEKIVDDNEDDHEAWYNLASAYALKGDVNAAADSLKKAIEIHDPNRERALKDRDFSAIGDNPKMRELLDQ